MEAVNEFLIIRKDKLGNRSKSGIYLPDFDKDQKQIGEPYTGIIESVGDLVDKKYKVGDRVLFDEMCYPYLVNDEENNDVLVIIKETDIICLYD